jgi:hypothetical protein
MDTDDLKAALARSRRQPMQFAVVLGKRPEEHRLSLHPTRAGRALAKALREDTGIKLATWGVTEVDTSRRDTLVLVLEDRALPGLGKKLQNWLKLNGAPIRKVALKVDGQEVDEGEDDEADSASASPDDSTPANTTTATTATTGITPPATQSAAPAADTGAELAKLLQAFKQLAPDIKAALLAQKGTARDLAQLVKACQQTLDEKDLTRARLALQQLAVRLRQVQAVATIEPDLGHAVLRVQHLAAELKRTPQCRRLADQGAAAVDTLRQLRVAKRQNDKTAIAALQARLEATRQKAREDLKTCLPTIAKIKSGEVPAEEAWVGMVALLDLASPENGAVFWSGGKDNAVDLATERGGVSLESTAGGSLIDDWLKDVPWDEKGGEGPPFLKDLWALASATYALQARGQITVIQTPKKNAEGGGFMWKRVEQQVLTKMLRQNLVSFGAVIVKETNPGDQ